MAKRDTNGIIPWLYSRHAHEATGQSAVLVVAGLLYGTSHLTALAHTSEGVRNCTVHALASLLLLTKTSSTFLSIGTFHHLSGVSVNYK